MMHSLCEETTGQVSAANVGTVFAAQVKTVLGAIIQGLYTHEIGFVYVPHSAGAHKKFV